MDELWFTIEYTENSIKINSNWLDLFTEPEQRYLLIGGLHKQHYIEVSAGVYHR